LVENEDDSDSKVLGTSIAMEDKSINDDGKQDLAPMLDGVDQIE